MTEIKSQLGGIKLQNVRYKVAIQRNKVTLSHLTQLRERKFLEGINSELRDIKPIVRSKLAVQEITSRNCNSQFKVKSQCGEIV